MDPPSTGNVLVGTATGHVAHAEDAYAQKPIEVRVKGRTVKNLWPAINKTAIGVQVTTDGTGLVTVTRSGTAEASVYVSVKTVVSPGNGKKATLLRSNTNNDVLPYVNTTDGNQTVIFFGSSSSSSGMIPNDSETLITGFDIKSRFSGKYTVRVMLVEGDTAPDCFVPTGLHSVEPTKLVTAGVQSGDSYEDMTETALPSVELRGLPDGTCDELVIKADGTCEVERRTQLSGDEVTALPEPTTEPQSPVTLPALPAPTFNVYHDGDVPSDTAVEYERDINIVIDNLAKQIAGTAATVAINEATR